MKKIKVGISIGDINGVGLEIIIKTLANPDILKTCIPVIYGSSKIVSYHKNIVGLDQFNFHSVRSGDRFRDDKVNVVNCWDENVNITLGKLTEEGGKFAYISLDKAVNALKENQIDALVTAPINKKAMQMANFPHPGHTEYLTKEFGFKQSLMLMVKDDLRVGVVTGHIPVKEIAQTLTKDLVKAKLKMLNNSLKKDFGIERPTIALLGLNPHASDDGVMGEEEEKIIRPVIIEAKKKGVIVMGPYPADGFFGAMEYKKFDGVLAMYHDQGLVPFKTLAFGEGVNFTAGINIVRTSPDHGTAYDIAGKNEARIDSFRQALFLAVDVARNREEYDDAHEDQMKRKAKAAEEG